MATTTATLPVCVYCGTARPADHTRCKTCDRPWIDVRVGSGNGTTAIPVAAAAGAVVSTGSTRGGTATPTSPPMPAAAAATTIPVDDDVEPAGTWDPPPSRRREWSMWAIPAVLGAAVLAVYALIFFGAFDSGTTDTPEATPDTIVATTATTVATTTPTTAVTTTTTTAPTTTTTVPPPDPNSLTASGTPISVGTLNLKATGIGPLEFGEPAPDIIGRMVASLGTAEATGYDDIGAWICEGDEGFWVRWSGLTAIFAGDPAAGTFVGFRFEEQATATSYTDLATLSGIRIGDSISDLEAVYSQYKITYDVVDGQAHFGLFDGDELLLWGPVSSIDSTGRIVGIYSPHACASA